MILRPKKIYLIILSIRYYLGGMGDMLDVW